MGKINSAFITDIIHYIINIGEIMPAAQIMHQIIRYLKRRMESPLRSRLYERSEVISGYYADAFK